VGLGRGVAVEVHLNSDCKCSRRSLAAILLGSKDFGAGGSGFRVSESFSVGPRIPSSGWFPTALSWDGHLARGLAAGQLAVNGPMAAVGDPARAVGGRFWAQTSCTVPSLPVR
jgi:hypothetical protein